MTEALQHNSHLIDTGLYGPQRAACYLVEDRGELALNEFHRLLHSRGRRHLSLLVGAVFQRDQLEELLGAPTLLHLPGRREPAPARTDATVRDAMGLARNGRRRVLGAAHPRGR